MELSPQDKPQDQLSEQSPGSHILHPEPITVAEPSLLFMGDVKTGEHLPTFDYKAALAMTKSTEIPDVSPVLITLEEEAALEREATVPFKRPQPLRPHDIVEKKKLTQRWGIMQTAQAAVTASLMSAAAMSPQPAEAGGIPGLEQALTSAAVGQINNRILGNTPFGVGIDQKGTVGIVAKSPQDMNRIKAMNLAPQISQETMDYAKAIGVTIINEGMIFQLQNAENPLEEIHFIKYHSTTHHTTWLGVKKAEGGGLLVSVQYVKDNLPKAQLITIRTYNDEKRNIVRMAANIVGN